jgi:hypothetical protein
LVSGCGLATEVAGWISVVVRCTLTTGVALGLRGAPRARKSCGRTATPPLTPCVLASTRGRTRKVGTALCEAAAMSAGDMPGFTAMLGPERLTENERLTSTVVRSTRLTRCGGR